MNRFLELLQSSRYRFFASPQETTSASDSCAKSSLLLWPVDTYRCSFMWLVCPTNTSSDCERCSMSTNLFFGFPIGEYLSPSSILKRLARNYSTGIRGIPVLNYFEYSSIAAAAAACCFAASCPAATFCTAKVTPKLIEISSVKPKTKRVNEPTGDGDMAQLYTNFVLYCRYPCTKCSQSSLYCLRFPSS